MTNRKPNVYGYIRVSTRDQNEERQRISMCEAGVPARNIFLDKQSGKDFDRPGYQRLLRRLRAGDLLVVKSIDRLGRNYEEIKEQWRLLTRGLEADIRVLDMPLLDTTRSRDLLGTFIADIVLELLSFVAENERVNIRQRQAEGIAAAQARGVKFGRPRKETGVPFGEVAARWRQGELHIDEAVALLDMGRSTFFRRLREHNC